MSSQVGEGLVKLLQVKSGLDHSDRSSQKFFKPKTFQVQHLSGPNILPDPKFCWTQIFLDPNWTKNYLQPTNILWDPKFFWTKNYSDPKFFGPKIILTQKFVWTQKFFVLKFFLDPKYTREWSLTLALAQLVEVLFSSERSLHFWGYSVGVYPFQVLSSIWCCIHWHSNNKIVYNRICSQF